MIGVDMPKQAIRNFGDLIHGDAAPDALALIDLAGGERRISHGRLARDVRSLAAGLLAWGLRAGDRVAIVSENSYEVVQAYLAIMYAGLVAVPVNYRLPVETIHYILEDSAVRLALVDAGRAALVEGKVEVHPFGEEGAGLDGLRGDPNFGPAATSAEQVAEILYTSGSTGRPKGVPLTHGGQLWALQLHRTAPSEGESSLVVAPLYHMNGLFNVTVALLNGLPLVLMPRFDAREYLTAIAAYRCTKLSGIPTMFAMAARQTDLLASLDLDCVRQITIASAPLTEALVAKVSAIFPRAAIQNGYGSTEAGPSIFGEHPAGLPRPLLALGYPLGEVEWRLVDGPSPEEGALELRTPALFGGYLNLPAATSERIVDGWYRTGDVMCRDEQGFFYFVGRSDDMFICGGENVYPGEIEKMLERHPGVHQAAVLSAPDEIKGQIPIAFVVRAPGASTTADELKAFALREGPAYSHPRAFHFLDTLPVAGTHKVDRKLLEELALEISRGLAR